MTYRRITAIAFAAFLAFIMLFTPVLVLAERDHDCSGEDCEICRTVAVIEETVKNLSFVGKETAVALFFAFTAVLSLLTVGTTLLPTTLTALKVKLSF